MKIQYDFFLIISERLGRMHENKIYFFMFCRKPGILIPDLYFYNIKIETNIDQNAVKKYAGKSQIFWKYFFEFFWAGPDPAQ